MDRACLDFSRLYRIHQGLAFFVIRAKSGFRFQRRNSQPVDKAAGLQCDQIVALHGFHAKKDYPEKLRRIRFYDREQKRSMCFSGDANASTL